MHPVAIVFIVIFGGLNLVAVVYRARRAWGRKNPKPPRFRSDRPRSKCYFTQISGVSYVDPKQVPTRRKPYSTFQEHPFSHTMDLLLPQEVYEFVKDYLDSEAARLKYSRVFLSLQDILEGTFFNEYIKKGNIVLLSEGRSWVDNLFSLRDGVLRLELDKSTYERCGLVGKVIPSGGRKHVKARFLIEFNLRLPSAVHGKNGFERLKYACKNVLSNSLSWLFCDLSKPTLEEAPIKKHHPFSYCVAPTTHLHAATKFPPLAPFSTPNSSDSISHAELYEFLSLVSLQSPRVLASDDIDPYLSRYQVPNFDTDERSEPQDLVLLRWRGLVTPEFVAKIWIVVRQGAGDGWSAVRVGSFGGQGYTAMDLGNPGVLCWECK